MSLDRYTPLINVHSAMIAIAPTDHEWFALMREESVHDVINFWTPTPWNVRQLEEGDRFYFMRKAPIRKIGGYGHFLRYENMTAKEAWKEFGTGNGVRSLDELIGRATGYAMDRSETFKPTANPTIGCIVLENPVFFGDEEHIDLDDYGEDISFPKEVVKHKYFEEIDALGRPVPEKESEAEEKDDFSLVRDASESYTTRQRKERKGQSQFRRDVMDAYGHECCITGVNVSEVLEAAHIQPYVDESSNHVQNGLPLRVDLHELFDAGLLTITTEAEVRVSDELSSDAYSALDGQVVSMPDDPGKEPAEEAIRYHNQLKYRGDL